MMKSNTKDKFQLALAMLIFGTIGPVRRLIPVDSMLLAMMRAFLAGIALYVIIRLRGRRLAAEQIRPQLWTILLVGVIMGFNWVFLFEAFKQVQLSLLLIEIKRSSAPDTFYPERRPLIEQFSHTENSRHACDEHIEVAGERVLEHRQLVELLHQLIGICAAL